MAVDERLSRGLGGLSRADLILTVLPPMFMGVYGIGALVFDTPAIAAAAASVACCVLIADGFFWHPPTTD